MDALGSFEFQPLGAVFLATIAALDRQATRRPGHHLLANAGAQMHVREQDVRRHPDQLGTLHIHPGTQTALAPANVHPKVEIGSKVAPVQAIKGRVPLALPVLPAPGMQRQKGLLKNALHAQALAPVRWRVGVHAQGMREMAVAQDQVHIGEF